MWYERTIKMYNAHELEPSEECIELIAKWEGFEAVAYLDTIADPPIYTLGFGETKGVRKGDTTTKEKAKAHLRKRAKEFWNDIKKYIQVPLTQSMCDALTSFSYNVGVYAFRDSTLLKRLNECEYREAADQFLRWNKAGGRAIKGLTNRRKEEREIFLKDI